MGALMREFDWTQTSLGPPAVWPEILKMTVRLLLSSTHPMFIWWGPERLQLYNDAFRKTIGADRHPRILGQPGKGYWEEIWPIVEPELQSIFSGGPATWHEEQLLPIIRDGLWEDVWWTYSYSPIQGGAGVLGVLVICNDVTLEHHAKEELKQLNAQLVAESKLRAAAENRLPSLFAQAPGFMAIVRGPEHEFEFTNAAYMALVGERELIGLKAREALPELAGQGLFELLDHVYSSGKAHAANSVPLLIKRPGDIELTQSFVNFVYQPMLDADGAVTGIFVEGSDVTKAYVAQQALALSQRRLEEGLDAARMSIWDMDLRTKKVTFSDNATSIFGGMWPTAEEAWKCIHPDDIERLHNARGAAIAGCGEYEEVVRLIRPDNGRVVWLKVTGRVSCDDKGTPTTIRGITVDITGQKDAEEALRLMDRRKDEFLATLAHELRNPLAPIGSAAQVLSYWGRDEPRIAKTSEIITRQVEHMTNLINDLLDVSRITTGLIHISQHAVDINQVIIEAVEQVMPIMKARGHAFSFQQVPARVDINGDQTRLVQVFTNLLQNAAKFTPEHGAISLSTTLFDEEIAVTISDSGIGIESHLIDHVFELFAQVKRTSDRAYGGLGLGLALVKNLVDLHGGRIAVQSAGAGEGSTFTVFLPLQTQTIGTVPALSS